MTPPREPVEFSPRDVWYPERDDITIYGILSALSDPTRLEIVRRLAEQDEQSPFDFLSIVAVEYPCRQVNSKKSPWRLHRLSGGSCAS